MLLLLLLLLQQPAHYPTPLACKREPGVRYPPIPSLTTTICHHLSQHHTTPSVTTTFDTNRQPICPLPVPQMPPRTRKSAAKTPKVPDPVHPSPSKTRKRGMSTADTEKSRKKSKPSINVEQDSKGGRGGKRAKVKGKKPGKNGCAVHQFPLFPLLTKFPPPTGKPLIELSRMPRWAVLQPISPRKSLFPTVAATI